MQKVPRKTYNIVLFTYNRYFTCFEAVNLVRKFTVQQSLNASSTSEIFAWLHIQWSNFQQDYPLCHLFLKLDYNKLTSSSHICHNCILYNIIWLYAGITVLLKKPGTGGVNTTIMFSEPFPVEVFPSDAKRASNPHATGACWTKADDEMVTRYGNFVSFFFFF